LFDLGISQKVYYATIYSQCFHILYFMEAGVRRKARENIGDFAGFRLDSMQNTHFVMNQSPLFGEQPHRPMSPTFRSVAVAYG